MPPYTKNEKKKRGNQTGEYFTAFYAQVDRYINACTDIDISICRRLGAVITKRGTRRIHVEQARRQCIGETKRETIQVSDTAELAHQKEERSGTAAFIDFTGFDLRDALSLRSLSP